MKRQRLLHLVSNLLIAVFICVVLWFAGRVFLFDKYPVSTRSMSPSIVPGDQIVVNKLIFGARVYKNLHFMYGDSLETFRMPGLRAIRRNDIVVFNFPFGNDDWQKIEFKINRVFAKRCIGIPGDTISIINGIYYNHALPNDTVGHYRQQLGWSKTPSDQIPIVIRTTFPFDTDRYPWTIKDFGPLYIPRKDDRIELNDRNFVLFKRIIEYETHRPLNLHDHREVCLGEMPISHYIFKENYYFMAGDQVADSQDSRYFGVVPETFIVGVASHILYSRDKTTGRFRWNRLMKSI